MKLALVVLFAWAALEPTRATTSPVTKVIELLSGLEGSIRKEGAAAERAFAEFSAFCKDRSTNLGFEIRTETSEVAELTAEISKQDAVSTALPSRIDELAGAIAAAEADIAAATTIRAKEAADFNQEEKELMDIIDMLQRAITVLEREMAKSGASMLEIKNAKNVADALNVMVRASMFSTADASRITALVQSSQDASDADVGAPDPTVYASHSGDIVSTLQDLLDKAQAQLSSASKKENTAVHNFGMLKLSLEAQIKLDTKDMDDTKADLAASAEKKATASQSLAVTSKALEADKASLGELKADCAAKTADYNAAKASRAEELKAISQAKQVISSTTAGADQVTYGLNQVSLLQLNRAHLSTGSDLAKLEAVRFVRDLAKKQHSPALAQLANRMTTIVRFSDEAGEDPFAKVKGLIVDMIAKLEKEQDADATHKAYCDRELTETNSKKTAKSAAVAKLSAKIEQMAAASAKLKEQTAAAQNALAELAKSQAEMDKIRGEEKENYADAKADMEQGIEGIKQALKILNDYYAGDKAHDAAEGAASSIVGLLEVVESDFTKKLAELVAAEESAVAQYEAETQDNKIDITAKSQDVAYMTREAGVLDKEVAEASTDRTGIQAELDAVLEYLGKLNKMCIAKPETYADRAARRAAEIAGLKEALKILEGEAVLLQTKASRFLRPTRPH